MSKAATINSISASPDEQSLQSRVKAAGMRLQRVSNDRYEIVWRHQCVAGGLSLLGAARFIDRALNR
jgi:hypothetical protein